MKKKKKETGKNGIPTYSLLEYEIETLTIHTKMRRLGFHNLNQQRTRKIITSSSSTLLPHLVSSCQETILSPQDPKPNTDLPSSFSFLRETKPSISCPVRFSYFFRRSTLFVFTVYLYVVKTEESSYRFSEQS